MRYIPIHFECDYCPAIETVNVELSDKQDVLELADSKHVPYGWKYDQTDCLICKRCVERRSGVAQR